MSPEAGASSSRPFEHTSVDETSTHNTLKLAPYFKNVNTISRQNCAEIFPISEHFIWPLIYFIITLGHYPGLNRGCLCYLAGMSKVLAAKIARTITHWHTLAGKAFLMMAKFVWLYNLPWCWSRDLGILSQMPYPLGQLSIHIAVEKWYLLQYLSIINDI